MSDPEINKAVAKNKSKFFGSDLMRTDRRFSIMAAIVFGLIFGIVGFKFLYLSHAASTTTYSGKLTSKTSSRQYNYSVSGNGQVDANLTFSSGSLTLEARDPNGQIIATKSGASPLTFSIAVNQGTYTFRISSSTKITGKGIAYTLGLNFTPCSNSGTQNGPDIVLVNCELTDLHPSGQRGHLAQYGNLSAFPYRGFSPATRNYVPWVYFRDNSTGAYSHVSLPGINYFMQLALSSPTDLWALAGDGPVTLEHFKLTGTPLPNTATLVSSQTYGDSDTRHGDLLALKSGAVVGSWGQRYGNALGVVYCAVDGTCKPLPTLTFMPWQSGKQSLAQHPADDSVWLFNAPDAWGHIGVAHMVEANNSLSVDWTDAFFTPDSRDDPVHASDPENPDIQPIPDAANGTIALAYDSAVRQSFAFSSDSHGLTYGSYPIIAHIKPDGSRTFTQTQTYAERISPMGLSLQNGQFSLVYHPVVPISTTDVTIDTVDYAQYINGAWQPANNLTKSTKWGVIYYNQNMPQYYIYSSIDNQIHLYSR